MHYEVYMHTREKLMELASGERSKLKEKMNQSIDSVASGSSVASCITREQDGMGKDQIETEKRRLEKVARRQQKELLRMLVSVLACVLFPGLKLRCWCTWTILILHQF